MKTKTDLKIPFTWEERRPILLERFFYIPKHYDATGAEKLSWNDPRIFGREAPVHIEFCSGNGEWIGARAKEQSDVHWVAVEMRFDRARKIWLKSFREEIPNLYVVCGEALGFLRHFAPPQSVARAFVHFPDPWPKLRHAKNRLIQAPFADALEEILASDGSVTLVTDDAPYHEQMASTFAAWRPTQMAPTPTDSFFARLWLAKGRTIRTLQYAR